MIQANELRIGNKVQDNNGFMFYVVSVFEDGTVYCDFKENEGDLWEFDSKNPCYGIPLTEEILLKCGFDKEFKGCYSDKNGFVIFENIYNNVVGLVNSDLYYSKVNGVLHLKHLHQLQNLYFSLTSEELNIEL